MTGHRLATWSLACAAALATGCAAPEESALVSRLPGDGRAMRAGGSRQPIVLPDLSGVAASVERQVRERHVRLDARLAEPGAPPAELADAFGELGLVLMAAEYREAAADCFRSAMDLAPDEVRWPYYLGQLHAVEGDRAAAAELFARAHELRPTDPVALVRLGDTLLDQSRPDAAEEAFMRALTLDSGLAAALAGMGRAALAKGEPSRAVDYLTRALVRRRARHEPALSARDGLSAARRSRRGRGRISAVGAAAWRRCPIR